MVQQLADQLRKGPWTEQEDVQLVFYVNLFGDRRWDFLAKVSGLKRSGKSCRLRWVNYLHPGLKRGKMTPLEERLILELHSKWGNRWSRIARKIPGRTDNEIKNYWRTHMRKKAQEKKKGGTPTSASSSSLITNCSSYSSSSNSTAPVESMARLNANERNFYDTGGEETPQQPADNNGENNSDIKAYTMDEIWKDIELSEADVYCGGGRQKSVTSPMWDNYYYSPETLWTTDHDTRGESKIVSSFRPTTTNDQFYCFDNLQDSIYF